MINVHPEICNLCGGKVIYTSNKNIYGREYGSGKCYLCTKCGAYVGTHEQRPKDSLGILANAKMRYAKKRCHGLFDMHWRDKERSRTYRTALYAWLADKMGIDAADCHFGHFTLEQLDEAYQILLYVKDKQVTLDKKGHVVFSSRN